MSRWTRRLALLAAVLVAAVVILRRTVTRRLIADMGRLVTLRAWEFAARMHEPYVIDGVLPVISRWCPACRTMAPCQPAITAAHQIHRLRDPA